MYTSMLVVALSVLFPAVPEAPSWQTDYNTARELGRKGQKPLAVFIASGKEGWHHIAQEGKLAREASRILAEKYVCLYIDTAGPAGREIASAFEVRNGPGLVISDRSCKVQAFRHEGDLANEELEEHLKRLADPDRVARVTETAKPEHVSYYPPDSSPPARYEPPTRYFSTGRSC